MWTRALLVASLFVSLAAFACAPESPSTELDAVVPPRQGLGAAGGGRPAGSDGSPAALGATRPRAGEPSTDANALGTFFPVFPGVSSDTHSTECDPFEDSSEMCL